MNGMGEMEIVLAPVPYEPCGHSAGIVCGRPRLQCSL